MLKLYVGCSLTHATQEFRDKVEKLKEQLSNNFEILKFKGLGHDPQVTYLFDIHECVASCDLMLAICDHPATALGWEMATMVEKHKKPLLAVGHRDALVTDLVVGADNPQNPLYVFERYDDLFVDVPKLLAKFVEEVGEDMWDSVGHPVVSRGQGIGSQGE